MALQFGRLASLCLLPLLVLGFKVLRAGQGVGCNLPLDELHVLLQGPQITFKFVVVMEHCLLKLLKVFLHGFELI